MTFRPFTGPEADWPRQARSMPTDELEALLESRPQSFTDLTPEDIEESLGAQKLEQL